MLENIDDLSNNRRFFFYWNVSVWLEYLMKYKAYLKWWFLLFKGFIRENDHGRVMDWFILQIVGRDARWMCSYWW